MLINDDPYLHNERAQHIASLACVLNTIDFEFACDEYAIYSALRFLEKEQDLAETMNDRIKQLQQS